MNSSADKARFVVDHMLGSLARWLRMLGYDALYTRDLSDDEIIETAEREGRIILTRDQELAARAKGHYIAPTSLDEQLLSVKERFGLLFNNNSMRCPKCNGSLVGIDRESAMGAVPSRSHQSSKDFWRCVGCGKLYWDGTHWTGILDRFRRLGLLEEGER